MNKLKSISKENKLIGVIVNRELFSCIYVIMCILWFFPLLGWIVNPFSKICFIWGAGLIVWDFIVERRSFQASYWFILVLLLISYGITILMNIQNSFYDGVKNEVYAGIFLLLLYVHNGNGIIPNIKKYILRLNRIIIAIVFGAVFVSLLMFFLQIGFEFRQGETILRQGFLENRLFGVYTSPNTGRFFQ